MEARGRRAGQPVLRGGRVVIVGGRVVGLSIAYHLSRRGYPEVTLVERRTLGSGTTAKGTGGIRQQVSTAINIELSRRAVEYFAGFAERVGEPVRFRQHRYLFLRDREEQLAAFRANVARQRAAGVPSELLEPREIPALMPGATSTAWPARPTAPPTARRWWATSWRPSPTGHGRTAHCPGQEVQPSSRPERPRPAFSRPRVAGRVADL